MSRRNPIVGSSTKKRLIHPNLMVREDARKAIGSKKILETRTKLPIQVETSRGEISAIRRPQKSVLWVGNTLVRFFGLKRLLLYLSKSAKVFLIHGPRMQNQSYICKVKATYASSFPHMHNAWQKPMFPYFE